MGRYTEIWEMSKQLVQQLVGGIRRYGRCIRSWSSSWSEIWGMGRYTEIWEIYKPLVQRLVGDMGRYGEIHGGMGDI